MAESNGAENNVIVVGSGLAGIAATCELLELGCSVTLIDKNPRPTTGNSSKASTGIMAPMADKQKAAGINDNMKDIQLVASSAQDSYTPEMLKRTTDVQWLLDTVKADGDFSYTKSIGNTYSRVLSAKAPHNSGQAVCASAATLFNFLAASGKLTIRRGEAVSSLTTSTVAGKQVVTGVELADPESRGPSPTVKGPVVICTGGFAGSADCTKLSGLPSTCDPRVDGAGIRLGEKVGASSRGMQELTFTPFGCTYPGDKEGGLDEKFCLSGALVGQGIVLLKADGSYLSDPAGKPMSDLTAVKREDITGAMKKGGGPFQLIIGKVPAGLQSTVDWYVKNQFVDVYSDVKACTAALKMPADTLTKAIGNPQTVYTVKVTPAIYACSGGLQTTFDGKVQDAKASGIAGLFAAGEAAAGPSQKVYSLAGVPLLHAIVSGRAAGKGAATEVFGKEPARVQMGSLIKTQMEIQIEEAKPKEVVAVPDGLAEKSKDELIEMVKKLQAAGPPAAAGPAAPVADATQYFELSEVAKHKTQTDAWVTINGDVLDVTGFISNHPGGVQAIMAFVGTDASAEWNQIHKPQFIETVGLKQGAKRMGKLGPAPAGGGAAPVAAGAPAADAGITLEEVAKHNKREDAWIAINGDVLDVTGWIDNHPGGVPAIMAEIGKDASADWNAIHRMGLVQQVGLKNGAKLLGKLAGGSAAPAGGSTEPDFWNLTPCADGEPPVCTLDFSLLYNIEMGARRPFACFEGLEKTGQKLVNCLSVGIIGAFVHLLANLLNNLGRTFLYTGNLRFKSERMGTIRTGLFMVFFVIAHSMDNQVTRLGRVQYNAMTYMMADRIQGDATRGIPWFDMYIICAVMLHASVGLKRSWEINMQYTIGSGRWKWMITGLCILTFLIQHLMDFRFANDIAPGSIDVIDVRMSSFLARIGSTPPFVFFCADDNDKNAWVVQSRDVYKKEMELFSDGHMVLKYAAFVTAVGAHLMFAWPKVITSDGLGIPKGHQNRVRIIGLVMAVVCCCLYMSVPLSFYFGIMPSDTATSCR